MRIYIDVSSNELKTILAGLSYLRANLEDVLEALSEYDEATGEDIKPAITEAQVEELHERLSKEI